MPYLAILPARPTSYVTDEEVDDDDDADDERVDEDTGS